jgi:hypothetical protein
MQPHEQRSSAFPRVRFGLLLESAVVPRWIRRSVDALITGGDAELALLIQAPGGGSSPAFDSWQPGSRRPRSLAVAPWLVALLGRTLWRCDALRPADISDLIAGAPSVLALPGSRGVPSLELTDAGRSLAGDARLDFILDGRTVQGAALSADLARWGVWSLHQGDSTRQPSQPPWFWELHDGEDVIDVALIQAGMASGERRLLRQGTFATVAGSYAGTINRALLASALFPAAACRQLRLTGGGTVDPPRLPREQPPHQRPLPGPVAVARLLARLLGRRLASMWRLAMRHDHWNIGYLETRVEDLAQGRAIPAVKWAPERRGRYAGDPFGWEHGTGIEVLYEDYRHATGTATIASVHLDGHRRWGRPSPALDIGTHLSYPFIVSRDGRRLVVPESSRSGAITAYLAQDGQGLERESVLLARGDLADATLVWHDSRWWLFAVRSGAIDPDTELMLFHARDLGGPWIEHPANPVKVDVRSARPAGPLFHSGGRLYRPGQDCASTYGSRVRIHRVLTLTEDAYAEEETGIVEPQPDGRYPLGLHTLTGVGPITLVDGKRAIWSLAATRRVVLQRLGRWHG